jgi:acetoin utilization protein AcuB
MDKHDTAEIMTKNLTTIRLDAKLGEAWLLMQQKRIRHLPVVDETGGTVGIISDRDLQRAMRPDTPAVEFEATAHVSDFMSWPARGVLEGTPVIEVASRMLSEKVSAFLVLGNDRFAHGIVTTDDLLRLLVTLLNKDPTKARLSMGALLDDYDETGAAWA